mmetsp:Transcript_29743/g.73096  ORF Transcript_29743/g.73096 Transcript_29743/m.73096 type:complete len:101 (-) Transcript_29743:365-667(-)
MGWFKKLVDGADGDMKIWTVFMNTHSAWCVDDLTRTVLALQKAKRPFFGPTRRADGLYQLYVEIPSHHYVEIDSKTYSAAKTGVEAKPWSETMSPGKWLC